MPSTMSRQVVVKAPPLEVSALIRDWWSNLAYETKQVKLDMLPNRFWGTFTDRTEDEAERSVHITISIESAAATAGEFSFGGGYGANIVKISCLIPDLDEGDIACQYLKHFMEYVSFKMKSMGVTVEIPDT